MSRIFYPHAVDFVNNLNRTKAAVNSMINESGIAGGDEATMNRMKQEAIDSKYNAMAKGVYGKFVGSVFKTWGDSTLTSQWATMEANA